MKKELKNQIIESISAALQQYPNFYLTNIEGLNAEQTVKLRRACFDEGIKLNVVKNTLFAHVIKGMENEEVMNLVPALKGNTAIMFCENPNAPAKLIKDFNKKGLEKPALKAAFVQECAYVGADKLDTLIAVKSREELIADIVALLQSPARNVISALQNAGSTIAGIVKTLSEKEEK
jgi:large subunit ribosomal protein L10